MNKILAHITAYIADLDQKVADKQIQEYRIDSVALYLDNEDNVVGQVDVSIKPVVTGNHIVLETTVERTGNQVSLDVDQLNISREINP